MMDDESHIRFIDAHAKGIGGDDDACLPFFPRFLPFVAFPRR